MRAWDTNPLNAQFTPGLDRDLSSLRRSNGDSEAVCVTLRRSEGANLELNEILLLHRCHCCGHWRHWYVHLAPDQAPLAPLVHLAPDQAPLAQLVNHGGHRGNVSVS
jgi:hypothetical protein